MMRLSRREALRLSVPFALGPLPLLGVEHQSFAAAPPEVIPLKVTDSINGWGGDVKAVSDENGFPTIVWSAPAEKTVAVLTYTLGARTRAVAHARRIRFRYRVDGSASTTLHFEINAAPLASGYDAVFRLPYPQAGKWREAILSVQEYEIVWNTNGPPQTTDGGDTGSLKIRLGKPAGANVTLTIGEVSIEPLPRDTPVNTSTEVNPRSGVRAAKDTPKVTPLVGSTLPAAATSGTGPRLMFTAADLAGIRRRAKETLGKETITDAMIKASNIYLTKAIDLPERGGQWRHWYICPKHGIELVTENAHRHVCPVDKEVFTGPPYDDVIFAEIHNTLADRVRYLGLTYQIIGDARYAAKAREILLAYAAKYPTYALHDVNGNSGLGGGRVTPRSADEASWLILMLQGCDLIRETLSAADLETISTKLFYPAAKDVIQKHDSGIESDQCLRNSAVGMTGVLFGDRDLLSDALDHPERGFQAQILRGTSDDGEWYEGRWSSHFDAIEALAHLAEAARGAGIDVYHSPIGERYKKLFLFPIQIAMPNGNLPPFNDNSSYHRIVSESYETAFTRWNDPLLARALMKGMERHSLETLLTGADVVPTALPQPASFNAPASGYAILRTPAKASAPPIYLAMKYGPHGGLHGHPDKLHFLLYGQEGDIFTSQGFGVRGSRLDTDWYRTTFAHNTLVVDEENQNPATGSSIAFLNGSDGKGSAVLVDAGPIYNGVRFRRAAFLLEDGTAVLLDVAEATDHRARTFDFVLHPNGGWVQKLPPSGRYASQKPGYSYLRNVMVSAGPDLTGTTLELKNNMSNLRLMLASDGATRLMRGVCEEGFSPEGIPQTGPCTVTRFVGSTSATHASIIPGGSQTVPPRIQLVSFSESNIDPQTVAGAAAIYVKLGDRRWLLVANPEAKQLRIGGNYSGSDKLAIVPA